MVLLSSAAGISRSSTIVVSYLMTELNYGALKALSFLRSRHSQAFPNTGFLKQLEGYEESLKHKNQKVPYFQSSNII